MTSNVVPDQMTYADAGVDVEAAELSVKRIKEIVRPTNNGSVVHGVGPFCASVALDDSTMIVASADGLGTKGSLLALMDRFEIAGEDIVHHSVNDLVTSGARPLFLLDYIGSSDLTTLQKERVVQGLADACVRVSGGCPLVGGETADMPDVYRPGHFELSGFIVGTVKQGSAIDVSKISIGDVLLGLPSSGLHSNGFSLARRVFGVGIDGDADEQRSRLDRFYSELDETLGDALTRPHLNYFNVLEAHLGDIKGIAHITGGGLPGNVTRILPEGLAARLDKSTWEVPPIFRFIQKRGNIAEEEMWRVFNMGLGMVLAVEQSNVDAVRAALPEALVVGEVVTQEGDERVTIE